MTEVPCTLKCHEQFYCDDNFCKPRCDRFQEFSSSFVTATDAVVVLSSSVCVLTGILVLVISCLRYKRMYVYMYVYMYEYAFVLVFFVCMNTSLHV